MTRYVTVQPGRYEDQTKRPQHPPYSRLWSYYRYPETPVALMLWKSGKVKETFTLYDSDYLDCDQVILGGYTFYTTEDSWQAQVLTAAGYDLVDYEGPIR